METLIHELDGYETPRLVNLLKETKKLEENCSICISLLSDDMKFLINLINTKDSDIYDIYDNIDIIIDMLEYVILTKIINDKF